MYGLITGNLLLLLLLRSRDKRFITSEMRKQASGRRPAGTIDVLNGCDKLSGQFLASRMSNAAHSWGSWTPRAPCQHPTSFLAPHLASLPSLPHALCSAAHEHAAMISRRATWRALRGAASTCTACRRFSQFPSGPASRPPTASLPMPYITEVTVRPELRHQRIQASSRGAGWANG
jgi:hypothetical protein